MRKKKHNLRQDQHVHGPPKESADAGNPKADRWFSLFKAPSMVIAPDSNHATRNRDVEMSWVFCVDSAILYISTVVSKFALAPFP